METEKVSFFKKVKKAIFNFEEYQSFSKESISKGLSYIFKLILIMAILITIATTYRTFQIASNTIEKFKNETPDFSVKDGILNIENNEQFQYIDEDNYFGVVVDSTAENIDDIEYSEGIMLTKERIYIKANNSIRTIEYKEIGKDISKSDIESILIRKNLIKAYLILGVILFITNIIAYSILIIINIIVLSLIGMIINFLAKTRLKYYNVFNISTYAITLSAILLTIYTILGTLSGITIKYFDLAYDIISYIYLTTVILMMKGDNIKNNQELFVNEKKEEKKPEIEEKQKENKDKKETKKNKKEKEEDSGEPEGSKA